jgi:hypothetical protein
MTRRLSHLVLVVAILALGLATSAPARRPATSGERSAIVRALPKSYRASIAKAPSGCVILVARVSKSGRFAQVTPLISSRAVCVKYAADGFFLLKRLGPGKWKTIFDGSDQPPCELGVPDDLISCAGDH